MKKEKKKIEEPKKEIVDIPKTIIERIRDRLKVSVSFHHDEADYIIESLNRESDRNIAIECVELIFTRLKKSYTE